MAFDPLGRLAAHAASPYPETMKETRHVAAWWEDLYRHEARHLSLSDLQREAKDAAAAVGVCDVELAAAKKRDQTMGRLPAPWEKEQERRAAAIEVANLTHRLVRLTARRDVLRNVLDQRLVMVHVGRVTEGGVTPLTPRRHSVRATECPCERL